MDKVLIYSVLVTFIFVEVNAGSYNCTTQKWRSTKKGSSFTLQVDSQGGYTILIDNITWVQSGPTIFRSNGKEYNSTDGGLKLFVCSSDTGRDRLGKKETYNIEWSAGHVHFITGFTFYMQTDAVLFTQIYKDGAGRTSTGDADNTISAFPSFLIGESDTDLGYLAYGGIMVGDTEKKFGKWTKANFSIEAGRDSGPMALFDKSGNALFMSSADQFMAASAYYIPSSWYGLGIQGGVDNVPAGFTYSTLMYYSFDGINEALKGWGETMRLLYNKNTHYRDTDFTNNYLSYWTDNGAYYVNYYKNNSIIGNMTYQEALLNISMDAREKHIPYRSLQYSVWYKLGPTGGNNLWQASPNLIPAGMKYMFEKTKLLSTAHSRWWDPATPYAKQNGGNYDFIIEPLVALPVDQKFWTDMFAHSKQWGMLTLMQDWLNRQFDWMNATVSSLEVARMWLMQMGEGARLNDVTIQYCMAPSRHMLQSLEIPVVTQARASDDYHPNIEQWRIGVSSMLADALGVAPFKDTFWTTSDQPDNFYNASEPYPALQAAVATLSTGPVGPGDMLGGTDRNLLMRCCREDGLILKPSKPAMAINAQIIESGFHDNTGPIGEVWSTYTMIQDYMFGIILAADLKNTYSLGPSAAGFSDGFPQSVIFSAENPNIINPFNDEQVLKLNNECTKANFCLYYTSPVLNISGHSLVLLGELTKWVPMSYQRVRAIVLDSSQVSIDLSGAPEEVVDFSYRVGEKVVTSSVKIAEDGLARLHLKL